MQRSPSSPNDAAERGLAKLADIMAKAQAAVCRRAAGEAARRGLSIEDAALAGIAEDERERREEERLEGERRRREVLERFGARVQSHMHEPFIRGQIDQTYPAFEATMDWLRSPSSYLVLSGGTGAGKTLAALWALSLLDGDFVKAQHLGERMKPWTADIEGGVKRLDVRRSLIVLDDLGTEDVDDRRFGPCFDDLIDCRQGRNRTGALRTIITTNIGPELIRARYHNRVISRLRGGTVRFEVFAEEDHRVSGAS